MITNQLFRECLAEIPAEVRRGLEISYAVAEKIADIMKLKGISKRDFAKKMHVSEDTVSKWLTGRYDFSLSQISKISNFFGCQMINICK
ncbi:MAG: helix-turn-helix transcriptional regulator [Bacteroidales bacterium]|nr:helix-turn-helix transcriptional regulator [Bacteroidales bacterium]